MVLTYLFRFSGFESRTLVARVPASEAAPHAVRVCLVHLPLPTFTFYGE